VNSEQWSVIEWRGCYPSNWKGVVVTEAMAHPAKFSSKLIRRIYDHMLEENWVTAGDAVVDPFGGVALGALEAMRHGLHWTGVELEERFHKIGNDNIQKWMREYGGMLKGSATLLHGDSRFMLKLIEGQVSVVSSPPYAESIKTSERGSGIDYSKAVNGGKGRTAGRESIAMGYGETAGQLGHMKASEESYQVAVSSPPYEDIMSSRGGGGRDKADSTGKGGEIKPRIYGNSDGQLSAMPSRKFEAAISSPPFLQSEGGTPEPKAGGAIDARLYARHAAGNKSANGYGESDGQLSSMKDGSFELAVSSPPFEGSLSRDNVTDGRVQLAREKGISNAERISPIDMEKIGKRNQTYGVTAGQLAEEIGDDFWLSARAIVEQVYESLAPGGHACWVVKDYVKAKQIVPFSDQWRQLCEAVGFETLHEHRAMLVHHKGTQGLLEGGSKEIKTESKSFFRRLAEKKGSPRIDWEVVWCMEKPGLDTSEEQDRATRPPEAEAVHG